MNGGPIAGALEYTSMDVFPLGNPSVYQATNVTLNSTNGYGVYYGGTVVQVNMALRGGNYLGTGGGIFALNVTNLDSVVSADIGFRCTYQ